MNTRTITVGDLDFELLEAGAAGHPRLLLVHGFTGVKEDFEDHIDALAARGWHVVAPDHRGHGNSSKPAGETNYSMQIMADDMIAVADALAWDTFVLLGHSLGGMIAQRMVTTYPSRVGALILMDTSPVCPDGLDPSAIELGKQVVRESGMDVLARVLAETGGPLETAAHRRVAETRPGYAERGERQTANSAPDMWIAIVTEIIEQPDRLDALRDVRVPTLVIVGDQDVPFLAHSERMAKTVPSGRLAVIGNAGHSPQFEAPEEWFAVLTGFLDEVKA